jgi:hypothetical protein
LFEIVLAMNQSLIMVLGMNSNSNQVAAPSFNEFLNALADAKGYAMNGSEGRAWVVTWPDGHITCETRPVLIKCRSTKVIEVNSIGQMILA